MTLFSYLPFVAGLLSVLRTKWEGDWLGAGGVVVSAAAPVPALAHVTEMLPAGNVSG